METFGARASTRSEFCGKCWQPYQCIECVCAQLHNCIRHKHAQHTDPAHIRTQLHLHGQLQLIYGRQTQCRLTRHMALFSGHSVEENKTKKWSAVRGRFMVVGGGGARFGHQPPADWLSARGPLLGDGGPGRTIRGEGGYGRGEGGGVAGVACPAGFVYKGGGGILDKTHPPNFGPTHPTLDPPRSPPSYNSVGSIFCEPN